MGQQMGGLTSGIGFYSKRRDLPSWSMALSPPPPLTEGEKPRKSALILGSAVLFCCTVLKTLRASDFILACVSFMACRRGLQGGPSHTTSAFTFLSLPPPAHHLTNHHLECSSSLSDSLPPPPPRPTAPATISALALDASRLAA